MTKKTSPEKAPAEKVGRSNDWLTPDWILEWCAEAFEGPIGFDPCPCPTAIGRVGWSYPVGFDGLEVGWLDRTFVNPPFSREGTTGPSPVYEWIAKTCREAASGHKICLLLPANRYDQKRRLAAYGCPNLTCTVNLYGRVKFISADTCKEGKSNMYPSELLFFNVRPEMVMVTFGQFGMVRPCFPNWHRGRQCLNTPTATQTSTRTITSTRGELVTIEG